ncbi:MAG TPA: nitrite/sulfite reductase [Nitrososphaerales archaeon]|nr:nitrite/sulfite reductase [Nitrososphaerales archaeon]
MTDIEPSLRTPQEDWSGNEKAKMATKGLTMVIKDINSPANLGRQFRDTSFGDLPDVAEALAKSYGIYTDFNRAKTGDEKEWMYMFRVAIPSGGPITAKQWAILDDVATKYTASSSYTGSPEPSLRLTTRQAVQLHWIKKQDVIPAIKEIASSGFYTINGCGDNVRNFVACPLSSYSKYFNATAFAAKAAKYFRLPTAGYIEIFEIDPKYLRDDRKEGERFEYGDRLLNRKFKISVAGVERDEKTGEYLPDNCVEVRTDDIGVVPIIDGGSDVERFQIFIGGSEGEKSGQPTFANFGRPLGIATGEEHLLRALDAIVKVHQEWGDRKNRNWARMKYVIFKMGVPWYRAQVKERGVDLDLPQEDLDEGPRRMHQGWTHQETDGRWCYGAYIETGRIIDHVPGGDLKTMVRKMTESYPDALLYVTPNQDLLFANLEESDKEEFIRQMKRFGYGGRSGRPYTTLRLLSGSCVGRDTCRLTYTDSERFEPQLLDEVEVKWGEMHESIGITGCERQCFRPATKTIGWMGTGLNMYALKLGGTEDGRHQGGYIHDPKTHQIYMRMVPRKDVPKVTNALFEFYVSKGTQEELSEPGQMGYFFRRVGLEGIVEFLKTHPDTAELMKKTFPNPLPTTDPFYLNQSLAGDRPQGTSK